MTEWFYAKGGQQSGPVTFEQLRELAGSGGLDPEKDLVWKSTMPDWLPSGQVQGLFLAKSADVAVPAADPSNPYAAPQSAAVDPAAAAGMAFKEILPGSEPIDVSGCVKRGFELTKRHFGLIFLVGLTYIGVSFGVSLILGLLDNALGFGTTTTQFPVESGMNNVRVQQNGGLLSMTIGNVFSIFMALGLCRVGLNIVSGKEATVGMLFGEGGKLLRAIGASIIFGLMVVVGFILLIVPGIYVMLRYGQFMYAIVDRNMGVMESLSYSSSITTNNRMNLFLLAILSFAIIIAGVIALLVGLIFAYPLV